MAKLLVKHVVFDNLIYNDAGSGAKTDLATWKPTLENDWYYLGPATSKGHKDATGVIVKKVTSHDSTFQALGDIDWEQVWNNKGSGNSTDYSLWRAIPKDPANYVTVGGFFVRSHNKPTSKDAAGMRAIHRDLILTVGPGKEVWTDDGSKADEDGAVWSISIAGNLDALDTGAFVPVKGHNKPPSDTYAINRRKVEIFMAHSTPTTPKTLLIGVDGVQYEKIRDLNLPNFRRLESTIAYTGGVNGELSKQATDSGPGWATILTGVWAYKHGVTSNNSGMANPNFFSLYKRIQTKTPRPYVASIVHWPTIHTDIFGTDVAGIDFALICSEDQAVTDEAVKVLKYTSADFVFLHFDNVDHVGHRHGFGDEYDIALRMFDSQLGHLLDTVQQQSTRGDWLVLVATDHGRDSGGNSHGSQTRSEKTIFIASNKPKSKPLNDEFTKHIPTENNDFDQLYGNAAQTSIAPTVLRHMGIEPQAEWQLDGIPLNGPLGVRKLMPSIQGGATVRWYSTDKGNVSILRNGKHTTVVPASQGMWNDPEPGDGTIDYTLILNGTSVSLRAK